MWSKSNERSLFANTGMTGTDLIEADLLKNAEEQDCQTLLDIGSICFKRGNYQKAMLFYSKAAGLSDLEGMRRLGCLYFLGRGVEKDYESSVKWLLRAANNGYAPAQYNIGFLYECGRGVPCDIQTAQFWYKCSASQGCSNAFRAIERLATANNSLESFEQVGLVHLNNQLCDLKKLIDLLNTKCSYYENMILDLDKDVKRLENEILKFKYYSETDDTASDY